MRVRRNPPRIKKGIYGHKISIQLIEEEPQVLYLITIEEHYGGNLIRKTFTVSRNEKQDYEKVREIEHDIQKLAGLVNES